MAKSTEPRETLSHPFFCADGLYEFKKTQRDPYGHIAAETIYRFRSVAWARREWEEVAKTLDD